jgi:hypothetical protein
MVGSATIDLAKPKVDVDAPVHANADDLKLPEMNARNDVLSPEIL